MRTLKELANETIDIQNACNLQGVVYGMSKVLANLRQVITETTGECSTLTLNEHPITKAWIDKLRDLAGIYNNDDYSKAFAEVKKLAGK